MKIEKITLHKMRTTAGQEVEYARVFGKIGNAFIGQTLMLNRLTKEQIATARTA